MEFLKSVTSRRALEIIDAFPAHPVTETVDIGAALGRVLAKDIISHENIPPFPRSLVDGFALQSRDTQGAKETNPALLTVKGEVRVGEKARISVAPGETVYVNTGSMIPQEADGVVMQEYTRNLGDSVEVTRTTLKGENIIFAGEDIERGRMILREGKRLSPFDRGILASLGVSQITVYRNPEIGLISSGDEIAPIEEPLPLGKVRDINRYTVEGLLEQQGFAATFYGIVKDSLEDISDALISAQDSSMILISGGSSKGDRDLITHAVENLGGEILFHGVNIKPGKPVILGKLWGKPIFGLPGHPTSCIICTVIFVLPLARRLRGERGYQERRISGILTTNVPSSYGIEEYVRVTTDRVDGQWLVSPLFAKSSTISSISQATGYIVVPEGREGYEKDDEVEVHYFD
jgi:molybdopterin molybdotransferase